ncbi:MAG: ATP-binding protein [Methylotetracoccus sp.]
MIVLVLTFGAQWLIVAQAVSRVAENQIASRLEHDGETILASLELDAPDATPRLNAQRLALVYQQPFSGHYYLIRSGAHALISRSLWDEDLAAEPARPGTETRRHADGPLGQPLLVWTRGYVKQGRPVSITVTEDLTEVWRDIAYFKLAYLFICAATLLAAVALQRADIRRALRPFGITASNLASIARGETTRLEPASLSEMRPLVDEINRLLELVERRLQQSRTAVGNLAHALKTPLASMFQTLKDPRLAEHPELAEAIRQQSESMRRLTEHELKRARLAGDGTSGASFAPKADASTLIRLLQTVYAEKKLSFELEAPELLLPYDREDLLELLGNLADNACKWAERRIRVRISVDSRLLIEVADDGPGCEPAALEQLARRGARLDESKHGHGLGLAIVQSICDAYNGKLTLGPDPLLGGFRAQVTLPARSTGSSG